MCSGILLSCALQAGTLLAQAATLSGVSTGTRGWETVPGVIRNDGLETFRIEVHVPGPVAGVVMNSVSKRLIAPQIPPLALRDDGIAPDRIADDAIYTAGPFRYDPAAPMAATYMNDPTSPAGLDVLAAGSVSIDTGTATESFLVSPSIGVLSANAQPTAVVPLADDVAVSAHLVNVRATEWNTQGVLRSVGAGLTTPARQAYAHLPDAYDFMIFFSTNRLERTPAKSSQNFVAGGHQQVQVNYTGTGQPLMNHAAEYGSAGRLMGLVVLDAFERGIYSANATHELLHQWSGVLPTTLNLSDNEGHYNPRSSIGSLLGGQRWIPNGDGTFTLDCTEGRNGARQASALDLYFMGLIYGNQLPDNIYTYADSLPLPLFICGQTITARRTITIYDMVRQLGQRTPGPAAARRRFNIAFVAESLDRMLTPTEMTFYETLAAHYTLPLPADAPPPAVGFNWAPITKFFGHGVTWNSLVNRADFDADGVVGRADLDIFTACATGPGISYRQALPAGCPLVPDASGTLRADLDVDGDVDQTDFAFFQRLKTAG